MLVTIVIHFVKLKVKMKNNFLNTYILSLIFNVVERNISTAKSKFETQMIVSCMKYIFLVDIRYEMTASIPRYSISMRLITAC